jgi:hypothetical protein
MDDGPAGKYLVDAAARRSTSSIPASTASTAYADGTRRWRSSTRPKATLMSYIIKGILNHQLPWGWCCSA